MLIVFECVNQLIPWYIIPGWPQPATYAAQHYVSIVWLQRSSKPQNVYTIGHVVFPADIRYCCGNDCTVLMRVSDWNKMIIASAYTTLMPFACRFTYCCRKICTELGVSEARSVININLITYIYIYMILSHIPISDRMCISNSGDIQQVGTVLRSRATDDRVNNCWFIWCNAVNIVHKWNHFVL